MIKVSDFIGYELIMIEGETFTMYNKENNSYLTFTLSMYF